MGHQINYSELKVSSGESGKAKLERQLNEHAEKYSDYNGGLSGAIRWLNFTYDSEEDAYEAIGGFDNGWYDQLAVKFRKHSGGSQLEANKLKREDLLRKIELAKEGLLTYKAKNSVRERKSEFVTCKKCSSRVNKNYVEGKPTHSHWNACPVCKGSLSSDSVIKAVGVKEEKVKKLEERLVAFDNKVLRSGPSELYWLVKTEFHV